MQSFRLSPPHGVKDSAHIAQQQHATTCMEHCPPGGSPESWCSSSGFRHIDVVHMVNKNPLVRWDISKG